MGNPIGQVVGALFSAYPMDKFGRKYTFAACVVLTAGLVFIQFFARSLQALLVGELLGGLVLGCYVVIAPAYASEVCPMALRGHLTSYTNLCFVIGQLLANGVTAGTSQLQDHWAYSIPFALQWYVIWGLLLSSFSPFRGGLGAYLAHQRVFSFKTRLSQLISLLQKAMTDSGLWIGSGSRSLFPACSLCRRVRGGSSARDGCKKQRMR